MNQPPNEPSGPSLSSLLVRAENPGDVASIRDLTRIAFAEKAFSSKTEPLIVDALREAAALSVSLVGVLEGRVVGHVAFSPVTVSEGRGAWYVLGPISVAPALQRRGIGSRLVNEGLSRLRDREAAGCVLVGNPRYYTRFGFQHDPTLILENWPAEVSLVVRFRPGEDRGVVTFHPAFSARS
jgi:putative acetyltransferase